jgi:hypothetical protein
MHIVFIIAALALALTAGFTAARPGHAGSPPAMTPFDGGGGDGGSINGGGPPG